MDNREERARECLAREQEVAERRNEDISISVAGNRPSYFIRDGQGAHVSAGVAIRAMLAFEQPATDSNAVPVGDAVKPFADFHGDLPDYDDPLRCVFESGVQYTVELLAKTLKVDDYKVCDGTEEFDGDLGGTMMNIVLASLPDDEHGDDIYPSEFPRTVTRDQLAAIASHPIAPSQHNRSLPHGMELARREAGSITVSAATHPRLVALLVAIAAEGDIPLDAEGMPEDRPFTWPVSFRGRLANVEHALADLSDNDVSILENGLDDEIQALAERRSLSYIVHEITVAWLTNDYLPDAPAVADDPVFDNPADETARLRSLDKLRGRAVGAAVADELRTGQPDPAAVLDAMEAALLPAAADVAGLADICEKLRRRRKVYNGRNTFRDEIVNPGGPAIADALEARAQVVGRQAAELMPETTALVDRLRLHSRALSNLGRMGKPAQPSGLTFDDALGYGEMLSTAANVIATDMAGALKSAEPLTNAVASWISSALPAVEQEVKS